MVLRGRVGRRGAGEVRGGRVAVQLVSEARVVVAVVGVLHFEDGFLAVLGKEDVAVLLLEVLLRRAGYLYQLVMLQPHHPFVGHLGRVEHLLRAVVREAQVRLGLVLEPLARGPLVGLGDERQGGPFRHPSHVGGVIFHRQDVGGPPCVAHDGLHHLRIRGAGEGLVVVERVERLLDDHHAAELPPKDIIIVRAEEVALALHAAFLVAVGYLALVVEHAVDGLYLGVVAAPVHPRPVGDFLLVAFQQVAVPGVVVVRLRGYDLVAEPRHEVARGTLDQRDGGGHVGGEAVVHVAVPWQDIFVQQHGIAPDVGFRHLVHGRVAEQVVATGECRRSGGQQSAKDIFLQFHFFAVFLVGL